jgi:ketosteroid isomerase-like protein
MTNVEPGDPDGRAVNVVDAVLATAAARDDALVTNDANIIAGFMADDWVYVGPAGPTPKADLIGWIASGKLAHHTMQVMGRPRVAVHGETVMMTSRRASSGAWEGVPYTADEWISDVFVRLGGRWRCVLSQKCPADP